MIEVLKQTLDALEEIIHWYAVRDRSNVLLNFVDQNPEIKKAMQAITSLRQAIAELESQEPVAWIDSVMEQAQVFASAWALVGSRFDSGNEMENAEQQKKELRAMLTTPPQRTWVGLTGEEVAKCYADSAEKYNNNFSKEFYRNIEAKLKERNT